ncbi:hypothetical protein PTQ21_09935 [Paenibacillus marchantiae]|uniref:hypothetical protein n=1 Tax=Paenibacillus TaxID=44249 RepID=UPI00091BDC0B|nr:MULTISPECIES: hypothetical protein [Paenibacillus]WDQ34531.1 hypothetical protein PTQ21_09935 [Paenibacillus marchantiae]SHN80745.1 hypothetical protein SAMN04487896_4588 [Paenibacillus sp. ov031]
MISQPFQPTMDIPYYYPCNFPLIHEILQRQGSISSLGLLASSRLYSLTSCSDRGLIKPYFHKLDYEEPMWEVFGEREFDSFEQGKAYIRERLENEGPLVVTGTSYCLPYGDDYRNPEYIHKLVKQDSRLHLVDHWLAVYGMDEEQFYVYDPVPSKYMGAVSSPDFQEFWKGNKNISELEIARRKETLRTYGTMEIRAVETLDSAGYRNMLRSALATQAHEFIAGRTIWEGNRSYYFGQAVTSQLLQRLHPDAEVDREQEKAISAFLFDMRWSRYFFRDLLEEAAQWLDSPHDQYVAEFGAMIARWEQAHKLLQIARMKRSPEWREQLTDIIEQLAADELRWYEALMTTHQHADRFRQIPSTVGNPAPTPSHREVIERIVLDSCDELNRYHNAPIPLEHGLQAPLYGSRGRLDSLELVTLLAVVEQSVEDTFGVGITLAEMAAASMPESPYRTVESLVEYLEAQLKPCPKDDEG